MSITFKNVSKNLNCFDKMKYFGHVKCRRVFATLMPKTFFRKCYTFCGKQKDINKHQGNISSIHTYDTWECRTSKNVKKLETSLTKKRYSYSI